MLSGSASVIGFKHWAELTAAYGRLLQRYEQDGYPWDDRIADVTSEMIEKEEALVQAITADPRVDLGSIIPADETVALIAELGVLEEEFATAPEVRSAERVDLAVMLDLDTPVESGSEPAPSQHAPRPEPVPSHAAPSAAPSHAAPSPVPQPAPAAGPPAPLSGVVSELRGSFDRLNDLLATASWTSRVWDSKDINEIRRELNKIDFYAVSIERIVGDRVNGSAPRPRCTLAPLRVALADFAAELSRGTGRVLDVELVGEEHAIDPGLLNTAALILQSLVMDTFQRCDVARLRVEVSAEERHGALVWRVADNGDNFVSDSRLDNDEQLAFYPRLRTVLNRLGRYRGVLWVEPGPGPRSRFEFTLPVSLERESLVIWGEGSQAFATRATQVCAVIPADSDGVKSDGYGHYVDLDGARVALFRLDGLYNEAPSNGDTVVVIGSLEKRIAFFAPGPGAAREAHVSHDAVPAWPGAPSQVARVDERRLPLLDADHVVEAYHSVTGTVGEEGVSGGVQDETELQTPHQATSRVDVPAPPDSHENSGENGVDVLVVEQSDSMRDALTSMLGDRNVRVSCVSDVDQAIELIETKEPRLIISEFRMPTMAAKRVVDALMRAGRKTPVLVTTSQTGKTADLLVEKLGASGYLSKPLETSQVTSTISTYLGQGVTS